MRMSEQTSLQLSPQTLNEKDAARYLGMSRIWLSQSRMRGTGPEYIRLGRTIRYAVSDLDLYLKSHRVRRYKC
jgi:predicted DNA-binding transcriptional regulator AlpA